MPYQFEKGIAQQMHHVLFLPGKIVIEAYDFISFLQQTFAEMRAEETGTACDQNFFLYHEVWFYNFTAKALRRKNMINFIA
jgi:hypothetical protein